MDDQSTDQPEPQTDSADSKRPSLAGWFFWFVMFLLVYVLSIGPAAKLASAHIIPERPILTIYAPLGWLADACPPVDSFFGWYLVRVWKCYQ